MYIVHITSEFAPIAKAGGLGDVVHGLSKQQKKAGHHVEVIMPKYDILSYRNIGNFSLFEANLWSFEDMTRYHNSVYQGFVDNVPIFFIDPHHNEYYFGRGQIYGATNDVERFLYFSRAALEFLYTQAKQPDIIHIHDWPTAAVAPLVKNLYREIGFTPGAVVFTIHNLEHQGRCPPKNLTRVGLRGEDYRTFERMQDPVTPSYINIMKGGIVYSDAFTTVSPKYSEEIQTIEGGSNLHSLISYAKEKLTGVLNGIDLDTWDPEVNPYVSFPYPSNPNAIDLIVEKKKENKGILSKKLGLDIKGPLIACITRIAHQKGPWLIQSAIHHVLRRGGAFILLGSTHDDHLKKEFLHLKMQYKANLNVHIALEFDEKLAHQIYASADAILIPSLFEPCGLTQMISMRYGTIPIARKTGGLADTVFDLDDASVARDQRTGFTFFNPNEKDLHETLDRVFHVYHENKQTWNELIQNGLKVDLGWEKASRAYEEIYQKVLNLSCI